MDNDKDSLKEEHFRTFEYTKFFPEQNLDVSIVEHSLFVLNRI